MKKYILLVILIMIVLVFSLNRGETVTLHQSVEEVVQIDFLYKPSHQAEVVYTLTDEEFPGCIDTILELPIHKSWQPNDIGGTYIIQITYSNGDVEILGSLSVGYYSGGTLDHDGWYYVSEDDLYELFSRYLDAEGLAKIAQ